MEDVAFNVFITILGFGWIAWAYWAACKLINRWGRLRFIERVAREYISKGNDALSWEDIPSQAFLDLERALEVDEK